MKRAEAGLYLSFPLSVTIVRIHLPVTEREVCVAQTSRRVIIISVRVRAVIRDSTFHWAQCVDVTERTSGLPARVLVFWPVEYVCNLWPT